MPHKHHHLFIGIGIAALLFVILLTFALRGIAFSTKSLTDGVAEQVQETPQMRSVTTFRLAGDVTASGNLTLNIAEERGLLAQSSGRFSLSLSGPKGTALTEGTLATTGTMQRLDTLFSGLATPHRLQEPLPRKLPIMGGSPLLMMERQSTLDSVEATRTADTLTLTGKGKLYDLPVTATLTAARETKVPTKESGTITLPLGELTYQTAYSVSAEPLTPLTPDRGISGELMARSILEILQIR